jgi:general secretion pathway protein D
VLGGLMQDTYEDGVSKVPLLGDLPVVGALFRNKARSQVKTDLYVFIRPVVVRDRKGLADLSAERFDFANDQATGVKRRDMPLDDSAASQLWPKPEAGQAK